jgi:hypothetical protein
LKVFSFSTAFAFVVSLIQSSAAMLDAMAVRRFATSLSISALFSGGK